MTKDAAEMGQVTSFDAVSGVVSVKLEGSGAVTTIHAVGVLGGGTRLPAPGDRLCVQMREDGSSRRAVAARRAE